MGRRKPTGYQYLTLNKGWEIIYDNLDPLNFDFIYYQMGAYKR